MRWVALALVAVAALPACGSNPAAQGCASDRDCPAGHCVQGTGVCVSFSTPLDAGVPDLPAGDLAAPDLAEVD